MNANEIVLDRIEKKDLKWFSHLKKNEGETMNQMNISMDTS